MWCLGLLKQHTDMKKNGIVLLAVLPLLVIGKYTIQPSELKTGDPEISSYTIDPRQQTLGFFWKDKAGNTIKNFQALQQSLAAENRQLVFAMNGGMFKKGLSPQGLYVENGKMLAPLDTVQDGYGNFYLQPNGVFYLTDDKRAFVVQTRDFVFADNIQFATQSGPMLLIDGKMHPKFTEGSTNVNIRNGVGILPDGKVLFAISKDKVNLYDFAVFFRQNGCKNALYLDGVVSRMYLPAQGWNQPSDIDFGVMIGETRAAN